jgi:hypothetical protein
MNSTNAEMVYYCCIILMIIIKCDQNYEKYVIIEEISFSLKNNIP